MVGIFFILNLWSIGKVRLNGIKVLGHIPINVFFLGSFRLVIPICIRIEHQRAAINEPFAHFARMEQCAVFVRHISGKTGIHPNPLIESLAPYHYYDMAIGISYFFTLARDEASRVAKSQIAVG